MLTTGLDRPTVHAVIALANRAPSVHNSQPWLWQVWPTTIHLVADGSRTLPATDPDGRDLRLSCGAALHHLRVALVSAGLGSFVRLMPDPARPAHLAAVEPFAQVPTGEDLALATAIGRRRSDRRAFAPWPVPAELLAELVRAAAGEGATLRVLERDAERACVARLVTHAGIEQALTPGYGEETDAWTGRSSLAREGVPAAAVPVSGGTSVPMRRFAAAELSPSTLGGDVRDGTVLAQLATDADEPADQLRAGQALSAVLLQATRMGLASDPLSQALEVGTTRGELRRVCLDGRGEPQIVLRLGWAPVSATPLAPTGRRPVEDTLSDLGHGTLG